MFSRHCRIVLYTIFKIELKIERNTYIFVRFRTSHKLLCSASLKPLCNSGWKVPCWKAHISHFEAHIQPQNSEYFQTVLKQLWCTIVWLFHLIFFYRNDSIKIKTDIISEDIKLLRSYICSLVEILCVLEEEIVLVCWQLPHDIHATEIFWIQPTCELSLFSFKLSKLVRYFYWL